MSHVGSRSKNSPNDRQYEWQCEKNNLIIINMITDVKDNVRNYITLL